MLTKTFDNLDFFKKRRDALSANAEQSTFILFAGQEGHLSPFRVDSSFLYLTGFEEPEAIAVIQTWGDQPFTLFVRDKDPSIEVWDGERYGPELAKKTFGADQCFSISDIDEQLPELLKESKAIYYSLGEDTLDDEVVLNARKRAQQLNRRSGQAKLPIYDPNQVLAPMRMVKDSMEIKLMREACELTARAHVRVMEHVKPGLNEKQSLADFLYSIYQEQAGREGYTSIVASGANACTLHYRANTRDMEDGDFLLIDAGGEKNYYTADITRTFPINGKFTEPQRKIYEAVLKVQKQLIDLVKVGFSLPELQEEACRLLCEKMIDLGLLKGNVKDLLDSKAYQKYYPHGVGHYIGLDVHDLGFSKIDEKPVPFKEGVMITVEPGIYVPQDDESVPKEFRGLGVRIEDDVLVTKTAPDVLTKGVPKEVAELESLIGSKL